MAKPSNPRLMARVLDAIKHLGEGRGSSAKQVLEILRDGSHDVPSRNLTMQVQRALKNAVTAGLLQLRSGRYKILIPLQSAVNNRSENTKSGNRKVAKNSTSKNKDKGLEDAIDDSSSYQPLDAGPRNRCSHCKKHKRRGNRRKRKRSAKRGRKRTTKQARERNSRKLRRRGGDEGASTRRERSGKNISNPGQRGQSEVPNGQRTERPGKTKTENNQDVENREDESRGNRDRSESSSGSEAEDDGPSTTRAKQTPSGRKKRPGSGSQRRASGSRKSSGKRKSSENRRSSSKHEVSDNMEANYVDDVTVMDCCEDDGNQNQQIADEDPCNVCEDRSASRTSI